MKKKDIISQVAQPTANEKPHSASPQMDEANRKMLMDLEKLSKDSELSKFNDSVKSKQKSFNLFSVLSLEQKETIHSSIIAYLFNPKAGEKRIPQNPALNNPFAIHFLKSFLSIIAKRRPFSGNALNMAELGMKEIEVETELGRIDIVIKLPIDKVVIGIENKIGAAEGEEQISRYQDKLKQVFANHRRYLVFLTPKGRKPETANLSSDTSVLTASYADILCCIKGYDKSQCSPEMNAFFGQVATNIEEEILASREAIDLECMRYQDKYKQACEALIMFKSDSPSVLEKRFTPAVLKKCGELTKNYPDACSELTTYHADLVRLYDLIVDINKKESFGIEFDRYKRKPPQPVYQILGSKGDKWPRQVYIMCYLSQKQEIQVCFAFYFKKQEEQLKQIFGPEFSRWPLRPDRDWWHESFLGQPITVENTDSLGPETARKVFEAFRYFYEKYGVKFSSLKLE
jgi:hypothetical protein